MSDTVYVLLIQDESAPASIAVFSDKQMAVERAKEWAKTHAYYKKDIQVSKDKDYVYRARYCPEGSTVSVIESPIIEG